MAEISKQTAELYQEETLRKHIDAPILKTVGLMNLWGLRTTWACAGMHYDNPAVKKDHAQCFQIFVHADADSFEKLGRFLDDDRMALMTGMFMIRFIKQTGQNPMFAIVGTQANPQTAMWGAKDSPHYHEYTNQLIYLLNNRLLDFKSEFKEQITLRDQNAVMKGVMPNWAYEPVADWHFTKQEILEMV